MTGTLLFSHPLNGPPHRNSKADISEEDTVLTQEAYLIVLLKNYQCVRRREKKGGVAEGVERV